jgi:hypothetical protein
MPRSLKASASEIETLLAGHSSEIRSLVASLRQLISDTAPAASEAVYHGWRGIGYTDPNVGYFCAIFPQQQVVRLGFEFGRLLPDPAGLLTGNGRQLRYLPLVPDQPLPETTIRELIQAALALPTSRTARLELLRNQDAESKSLSLP